MRKTIKLIIIAAFNLVPRFIHNLLIRLAGKDPALARKIPFSAQIKIAGYGLSILMAVVLATLAGWHTVWNIVHNAFYSLLGGLLWGAMVGLIDYMILVYINKRNSFRVGITRVFTAVILSLLTSTPLVLLFCKGPVNEYMAAQLTDKKANETAKTEYWLKTNVEQPLKEQDAVVQEAQKAFLAEIDGTGGSMHRNIGPIARQKQIAFNAAKAKADSMLHASIEIKKQKARELDAAIKDIEKNHATDELAQLKALLALTSNPAVLFRWLVLMSALILIEMTPLILKLSNLGEQGPYDEAEKAERAEYQEKINGDAKVAINESRINTVVQIANKQAEQESRLTDAWLRTLEDKANKEADRIVRIGNIYEDAGKQCKGKENEERMSQELKSSEQKIMEELAKGRPAVIIPELEPKPDPIGTTAHYHAWAMDNGFAETAPFHIVIATGLSDHPFRLSVPMQKKAIEIAKGASSARDKVHRLYEYLHPNFPYDEAHEKYKGGYRTAEDVFHDRVGICGELAALFIAMARAMGLEVYFAVVRKDNFNEKVLHACAYVVYQDGTLPQLVDIAYNTEDVRHVDFEVLSDSEVETLFASWRRNATA
ncbi:MAG TPA: DUF4407 domain-containing protein [Puia sp.]